MSIAMYLWGAPVSLLIVAALQARAEPLKAQNEEIV
jgi:hypothetical protein